MYSLSELMESFPSLSQDRMSQAGLAVWIVWDGELSKDMYGALREFGGNHLGEIPNQSLWFFEGDEVFRALSRLQIWSRLNPIPACVTVVPAQLKVGYDLKLALDIPESFKDFKAKPTHNLKVHVHENAREIIKQIPGLTPLDINTPQGLTGSGWVTYKADQGLDYQSQMSWYFIIRPLGKMAERESVNGWRAYMREIEDIIRRLGLKYLLDESQWFVILPVDSLAHLREWCKEITKLAMKNKDTDKPYWPTVMAAIPQKGLPFTTELPNRFDIDWNKLTPDMPHLHYSDAFLMGAGFQINDAMTGGAVENFDSWASVTPMGEGEDGIVGSLNIIPPRKLIGGENEACFYCGMHSHSSIECPSRILPKLFPNVWKKVASAQMDDLRKGLTEVNASVGDDVIESMEQLLFGGKALPNQLTQGMFELNYPTQLRMLELVWRSRGKEWPDALNDLMIPDKSERVWRGLQALREGDIGEAREQAKQASLKQARSYQPASLQGFISAETGDLPQAKFYWEESERLCYTPFQRSFFIYLQARCLELEGDFKNAHDLYQKGMHISPKWEEFEYRMGVCLVKLGFAAKGFDLFFQMMSKNPGVFNRLLLDPEIDRGRIHIQSSLWELWESSKETAIEQRKKVDEYASELSLWFDESHPFFDLAYDHLEKVKKLAKVENYVAFQGLINGLNLFSEKMEKQVDEDIHKLDDRLDGIYAQLSLIRGEAAWFPFPRLLREYNRDYNYCVDKINWINSQKLKVADNFRRTLRYLNEIDIRIAKLHKSLGSLRIIRDGTLFSLILGKTFIWLEVVFLGLAVVGIPLYIYFIEGIPENWFTDLLINKRWAMQKAIILMLSIFAFGLAILRSMVTFEKRKQELFAMNPGATKMKVRGVRPYRPRSPKKKPDK
ncbi:MAG: tetratricopeptide repeat protein [Desulfovibrio sp.]